MHTIFRKGKRPGGGIGRRVPIHRDSGKRVGFRQILNKSKVHKLVVYMFYAYALASEIRNYIYVGLSSDLEKKIHAHNSGYERTTKAYRPFKLIYKEECATCILAREL